jgi:uncharacterized protein with von Willebrand factor type A (vWA) domain
MKRLTKDVARWDVYLWREARGLPPATEFDDPRRQLEDELFGVVYSGEVSELPPQSRHREHGEWADKVHAQCAALPQFERLVSECRGDAVAAATAVEELLEHIAEPQAPDEEHLVRRRLRAGCVRAAQAVAEVHEALAALEHVSVGAGTGTAIAEGRTPDSAIGLARKLRELPKLRELARIAGRVRQIASTKRRARVRRVPEEYGDVELGGDLGRLLPSSLMRLVHPKLRRVELRALVENQSLQYGVHGNDTRGAGPIVICVDKSGSMKGSADTWSTALTLALLDQAQEEQRVFAVLAFDGQVKSETIVRPGEKLPLAALFTGCDGGTDIDHVIERALDLIKAGGGLGRADVILVTDGVSDPIKAADLRERAATCGVSIFGVGIGVPAIALEPWCSPAISTSELATLDSATANVLFAG